MKFRNVVLMNIDEKSLLDASNHFLVLGDRIDSGHSYIVGSVDVASDQVLLQSDKHRILFQ